MSKTVLFLFLFSFALQGLFSQETGKKDGDPFSKDALTSEQMLAKGYKRYQVESGIIVYELSGTEKGTLTIYFDRWGLREAQYKVSEMKVLGFKQKTNSVMFLDGENQYNYTPENNTYFRIKNTLVLPVTEDMGEGDMTEGGKELYKNMGGEMEGYEDFMNRNCEVWVLKSMNIRQLLWKGVPMKLQSKVLGVSVIQTAVEVDIDVAVSLEKLSLPTDATSATAAYGY